MNKVIPMLIVLGCISFVVTAGAQVSVGGDFGRAWLTNFLDSNQAPVETDNTNDLWSWGSSPKGKVTVNGMLEDASNLTNVVDRNANWLGDTSVGNPAYLNNTTYSNLADNQVPMSPLWLSNDPWIRAQQLGVPVQTPWSWENLDG